MPASSVVRDDGGDVDLDEPFRPRQRRHDETGRDRKDALQVFADLAIDRLAITWIGKVDGDLADVLKPRAGLLQQSLDVGHRFVGLTDGIAMATFNAVSRSCPTCPRTKTMLPRATTAWHRSLSSFCSG